MRNAWLLVVLLLTLINCTDDASNASQLIHSVPENASYILRTNSMDGLRSSLKNNSLLGEISNYQYYNALSQKLEFLNYLRPEGEVLIAFGKGSDDSLQISVITKFAKSLVALDSMANRSVESFSYKNHSISKTTIDGHIFFSTTKDNIFFASNDRVLVENSLEKENRNPELLRIYESYNPESSLSVLIDYNNSDLCPILFENKSSEDTNLTDYLLVDVDVSQDQILMNGITTSTDSTKLINNFKETVPQENHISKVCPASVDGFLSLTFDNYKTFEANLNRHRNTDSLPNSRILDLCREIGTIKQGDNRALMLYSIDATATSDALLTSASIENFREVDIFPHEDPELFSALFAPFITFDKADYYINLDDFFVFSDDLSFLKEIISDYQNNTTLYNSDAFKNSMQHLSDEASLMVFYNSNQLNHVLDDNFSEKLSLSVDTYKASAIQFIYEDNFAHVNAIIQKNQGKRETNAVSEGVNVKLDANLMTEPQFFHNHTNNEMDILVQDIKNDLYLISNDGKVLWKKRLDGKILGKVEQMDTFKNGRLQLVFATSKQVYVLDRNGKDVGNFPLKFKDEISQPLSVFDYDNNKNYRLLVTQGKSLLMYDKDGKTVSGFKFEKADNSISTQPKHFRIGSKDYIVFNEGNNMEILSRVGKTRVNVKNDIDFSDNDIFLYNNQFTTTTAKGDLIQIDSNGKMSSANLNLGEKHSIASTSKTLVSLSDNRLKIKSNEVELDYGVYTDPKIFYIRDKIYVSVTDLQAKKVYLFDSQGQSIPNFPVYGVSSIDMANADKDRGLEFVVKGEEDSIIIYHIN